MLHGAAHLRAAFLSKIAMAPGGVAVSWNMPSAGGAGSLARVGVGAAFDSVGGVGAGSVLTGSGVAGSGVAGSGEVGAGVADADAEGSGGGGAGSEAGAAAAAGAGFPEGTELRGRPYC